MGLHSYSETIHFKCQTLFSGETQNRYFKHTCSSVQRTDILNIFVQKVKAATEKGKPEFIDLDKFFS